MLYVTGVISIIILIIRILRWSGGRSRRPPPEHNPPPQPDTTEFLPTPAERGIAGGRWHAPVARYDIAWDSYIIRETSLGDGYQLLDTADQPVFDELFEDIRYDVGSRMFICRHRSGARIFAAVTGQHWDAPFQTVFIDEWGNHTFRDEDHRYGVLDENFQPAFKETFDSLDGIAKGFFKVREPAGIGIIAGDGSTLLRNLSRVGEAVIEGRLLVVPGDGRQVLCTLETGEIRELTYDQVFVLRYRNGSSPQKNARLYLALRHMDELVPGTAAKRRKLTVLSGTGTALFDPGFDDLTTICVKGRYFFIAGTGDSEALWQRVEEATAAGGILSGTMRYALYDEEGGMLIPPDFTEMDYAFDGSQLIVTVGGQPHIVSWHDDYLDQDHLSWEMRGGRSGVLDLTGDVVIPLEWDRIEADFIEGPVRQVYAAREVPDGNVQYFDMDGNPLHFPDPPKRLL